jgi:hypothetical protein
LNTLGFLTADKRFGTQMKANKYRCDDRKQFDRKSPDLSVEQEKSSSLPIANPGFMSEVALFNLKSKI